MLSLCSECLIRNLPHPHKGKGSSPSPASYHCGKLGHSSYICYLKNQLCRSCGENCHLAKVCKSAATATTHYLDLEGRADQFPDMSESNFSTDGKKDHLFNIKLIKNCKAGIKVRVTVDNRAFDDGTGQYMRGICASGLRDDLDWPIPQPHFEQI